MDSFYRAPRQPPTLPTINPIERIPMVPEVSVTENFFCAPVRTFHTEATSGSFISKKQVRFQNSGKENIPQTLKSVPDLNGKTFKQIYMANVPDRHLDLSIFEPPKNHNTTLLDTRLKQAEPCKSVENMGLRQFEPYKHVQVEPYKSIESMYNHSPKQTELNRYRHSPKQTKCMEISTQTEEKCTEIAPANDEPTIKDLYHIIQRQNEQIMMLQRQVNNLKSSIRQPEIDSVPFDNDKVTNSPKKGMFSFDVKATSFEFSFRPPPQHKFRRQNEYIEPKIQEIVESDTTENHNSLHLDGSLNVGDSYVSDVPSIEIKMDDYCSSDEEEGPQANVGLTFYKDLMDQVNNVLRRVQKQSECQGKKPAVTAVKEATLQHLRNIGVNLTPIQESSEVTEGSELDLNNQADVNCAVQQLLMKYLPEDKLTKAIHKQQPRAQKPKEKKLKPPTNEFSFATLQYMKKYNIIDTERKLPQRNSGGAPKILDVTALKLQPKLL